MSRYIIPPNQNEWLNNFIGKSATKNVLDSAMQYLFENGDKCNLLGTMRKKSLALCINPSDNSIEGIGGSSLLYDTFKDRLIENLILDNFGIWFAAIWNGASNNSTIVTLKETGGTNQSIRVVTAGTNFNSQTAAYVGQIQLGSGITPPARSDFKIQTALGNAPESGLLVTNQGGYTAANQIVYQADANPTGGSGSVAEIATIMSWSNSGAVYQNIAITHDAITPSFNYTANKLLRGSYAWQI